MATRTPHFEAWTTPDNERFRLVHWAKGGDPKASENLLFIQHGLGEHGARYQAMADGLDDLDAHVVSFDARGHGESVGKRGDANGIAQLADDLMVQLTHAIEVFQPKRVIVLGHSMGGAVLCHALLHHTLPDEVVGAVISAPAVSVNKTLEMKVKLAVGNVLGKVVPTLSMGNGLDPQGISSDASEVRRYIEDPLVHDRVSARLGISIVNDGETAGNAAERITLPTLVYQGKDDPIIPFEGTQRFAERLGSDDKTIRLFEGMRHECHHESSDKAQQVFDVLKEWLGNHFA